MFTIFQRRISKLSTSAEVNFSKLVRAVYIIFPSCKWKPPLLKSPPNKLGPDSFVLVPGPGERFMTQLQRKSPGNEVDGRCGNVAATLANEIPRLW